MNELDLIRIEKAMAQAAKDRKIAYWQDRKAKQSARRAAAKSTATASNNSTARK